MPTAYELLSTEECDDILVIDLESRTINIPKNVTVLGVESDDETRVLHFQVPRHYCNVDLSEFSIRINYKNAKNEGDLYIVAEPVIEDYLIKFDWIVGRHAFACKGDVKFSITLKDVFEGVVKREFNTTFATLPVLEGMEPDEALTEAVYDYIDQWGAALVGSGDSIKQEIADKGEEVKEGIGDAVYDYVEEHSVELRGPKGDPFTYDDFTEEQLSELTGPPGPQGETIKSVDLIQPAPDSGDTAIYEITTNTNNKFRFSVRNGYDGIDGRDGETITSFEQVSGTGAPGTRDVYSIKTSSGKDYRFSIYHGRNGDGAGDMVKSIYDPQGKNQDIFAYIDNKAVTSDLGDNPTGGVANDTVATWSKLGNGVAWISELNQIVGQPSQYGFIINYVHDTDVFQIFHDQTSAETYIRSGDNINAWFQNWRRLLIADEKKLATEEYVDNKFTNLSSETFTFVMDDGTEKTVTVVTK